MRREYYMSHMDDLNIMEHPIFFMDDLEKIRATPMTLGLPSDSKM